MPEAQVEIKMVPLPNGNVVAQVILLGDIIAQTEPMCYEDFRFVRYGREQLVFALESLASQIKELPDA